MRIRFPSSAEPTLARYDPGLPKAGQGKSMIDLPNFSPLRITRKAGRATRKDLDAADHALIVTPLEFTASKSGLPHAALLQRLHARGMKRTDHRISSRLENTRATGVTIAAPKSETSAFDTLTWARETVSHCLKQDGGRLLITVVGFDEARAARLVAALVLACEAAAFSLASFKSQRKPDPAALKHVVLIAAPAAVPLAELAARAYGNNIARWFTTLPPNVLDAKNYRHLLIELAKAHGLQHEFISEKTLARRKAGAFLAVAQGNADREAGILRLSYVPRTRPTSTLALVGKGIIFDTGGNNLKPFKSMLDMHMDMQGSAVAAGLIVALAQSRAPYRVDAWLAITENRISARAYKSQDVVTASNGVTIQVVHTDAEGRMVLADTLALAARDKPDLILDFATLTGACETALTSAYSGVFTNRPATHSALIAAGSDSGERVWPFPMDADFDEALRSDVADVRQCTESGSGDHILAAKFLARFVPASQPWIHVDLSAGQRKGGLAHIPTECTGFGVGFSLSLLGDQLHFERGFAAEYAQRP
jgi:leucyl aminopeptidase